MGDKDIDRLFEDKADDQDSDREVWAGIANQLNAMQAPDSGASYGQRYDAQGALDSYAQAAAAADNAADSSYTPYLPGGPVEGPPAWSAPYLPGEPVEGPPSRSAPYLPGELIEGPPAQEDPNYLPGDSVGAFPTWGAPPPIDLPPSYSFSDTTGGNQQTWIAPDGSVNQSRAPSYSEEETYISPEDLRK